MRTNTNNETMKTHPGVVDANSVYTLAELQDRLGLGKAAWRTARAEGLPLRRVGRRAYVTGRDIVAWLESKPVDRKVPNPGQS